MGAYDCDCTNNLEYDRRERKAQLSKEGTTKGVTSDLISKTETVEHLRRVLDATVPITDYDEGYVDGVEFGISIVSTMPIIQPQSTTGQLNDDAQSTAQSTNLIDRQAAIDALWKALYEYEDKTEKQFQESEDLDVGDWIEHRIFVQNMNDIDRQTILNLPSAQPEPQWIPVSERLPEEKDAGILKKFGTEKKSEYVLATVEVKGERMTVTACTYDGKWDWNMKYAFPDFKVIAWMPLPEPYKPNEKQSGKEGT